MNSLKKFYFNHSTSFDKIVYQTKQKTTRRNILSVVVAIIVALLLSFIIITATGTRPEAFFYMFVAVFEDVQYSQNFAVQMCTYIVAALAFSFCMKVGIFNIGISGQMLAGGSLAFFVILSLPTQQLAGGWVVTIILSILGATFVSLVTGLLKIYCKVNEVVSGILLNWIVLYIVGAILMQSKAADGSYLFLDDVAFGNGQFISKTLDSSFTFTQEGQYYGWGFSIGITLICIVVVWVLLKYTVYGHKLKTVGHSLTAANNFGYNKNMLQLSSFLISGVLAGVLAVIVYTAQMSPKLTFQAEGGTALSSVPSQGFDGIAIGLIALNNPIGILLVSFVFTFPDAGSGPAGLATNTIQLIMGIIMYIVAIYTLLIYFKPWRWIMSAKLGKCNKATYMDFENNIFEISENYSFSISKLYKEEEQIFLQTKINEGNPWFKKMLLVVYFKIVWFFKKMFDKKIKLAKKELKTNYLEKRNEISKTFKKNCVFTAIDYYESVYALNLNSSKYFFISQEWKRLKNKIVVWANEANFSSNEIEATSKKVIQINSLIASKKNDLKAGGN
ncbi:MAG: ABC transporter permease [Malacoplasma sp.]|nr:ABC transporter permease [Malacoplasma sp.]